MSWPSPRHASTTRTAARWRRSPTISARHDRASPASSRTPARSGSIQIRILPPRLRVDSLERRIAERHGVRARVVAIPEDTPSDERYARTAHAGALAVADLMDSDAVLALSWGTMVNAISTQLPSKPCTNSRIVQANGLGQSDSGIHYSFRMLERFASAFGSSVQGCRSRSSSIPRAARTSSSRSG